MATARSGYAPGAASGSSLDALREYVERELLEIARSLQSFSALQLVVLHNEPPKPRPGMVVYADGTDWDPGAGEGVYVYSAGAWVQL